MASASADLSGIMVALITPFDEDGSISAERLDEHIKRLIKAGVHGLVAGGTTGEFSALTYEERKKSLELVIESAAGKVPIIAGIGALSTKEGVELAIHAANAGADALMVLPPFYDAPNLQQLKEHISSLHNASKLPVVFYNIPSASGVHLSPAELASLQHVGVKYIKDTSGNGPALTELMFGYGDQITTFNGWDTLTFYGLAAGAKGSIWGATNIIPELTIDLWKALAIEKDLAKGVKLWEKIWPLCAFLEEANYPSAVKTALELQGIKTGGMRKPFALLEGDSKTRLIGLLKAADVKIV